jgi:KaiC/GvpD/RAD55 family RecA-like ATPase
MKPDLHKLHILFNLQMSGSIILHITRLHQLHQEHRGINMDLKAELDDKKYERPEKAKAEFQIPLSKFKRESGRKAELARATMIPSSIPGMNGVLGGGYVRGTLINVVGFPKAGKSTLCIHESLGAATEKKESFIMFNESPQNRYMDTVESHMIDLGIQDESMDYITFANAHEKDLKSASYDYIDKMSEIWIRRTLERYLEEGHKPTFVVFDSLTKFYRTYAAQAFRFVQATVYNLHDLYKKYDVHPVTFIIHQKASKEWAKDDAQGFGGWGPIHEMDGSIVISTVDVDTWFSRDTGFPIGTRQRFIRADSRYIRTDELEYYLYYGKEKDGRNLLKVGKPLVEIVTDWKRKNAGDSV